MEMLHISAIVYIYGEQPDRLLNAFFWITIEDVRTLKTGLYNKT